MLLYALAVSLSGCSLPKQAIGQELTYVGQSANAISGHAAEIKAHAQGIIDEVNHVAENVDKAKINLDHVENERGFLGTVFHDIGILLGCIGLGIILWLALPFLWRLVRPAV